ncbi:MAG TPA: hypothetical protein VES68_02965 [Candidatus Sulfotelmatobacter sp.]|nr:hypothetical protein [Candidatus Sulfotelmatobacter sp.]
MKSLKYAISYGFLTWLLPFVFSVLIFFLHENERALFESLMSVFGVFTAVLFTNLYFKKVDKNLKEGIFLGIIWILINLAFDFLFFIVGPARMNIWDYIKDIGISYLSIPIITIGFTYLPKLKKED